jgi:hypothetical protein
VKHGVDDYFMHFLGKAILMGSMNIVMGSDAVPGALDGEAADMK